MWPIESNLKLFKTHVNILFYYSQTDEGRFKDDYMEGQGTMKMNQNVIIAKYKEVTSSADNANGEKEEEVVVETNDWMIPLQFQSDISHIHQKAGFTQVGL